MTVYWLSSVDVPQPLRSPFLAMAVQGPPTKYVRNHTHDTAQQFSRCSLCVCTVLILLAMQVKELGSGSFGTCMLAEDADGELVAVKFIPRGSKVYSSLSSIM